MITLAWIKGDQRKWKTFVANRVSEINNTLPHMQWHHVRTTENPVDIISRGTSPSKLITNEMWWNGPTWLQKKKEDWPIQEQVIETKEEEKVCVYITQIKSSDDVTEKFSSWTKLIRVIAYCNRFIWMCKNKTRVQVHLSTTELGQAMTQLIKSVQNAEFATQIKTLRNAQALQKSDKLKNLNPFLDENGILRTGGRLKNAKLPYDAKYPIIIPQKHHIARLIIDYSHKVMLHAGTQATQAHVRQRFWIPNAKKLISAYIRKCTICIRYKAETARQIMGDLPAARVTQAHPFQRTGIDYAGPIPLKSSRGRGQKQYKG